MSAMNGLKTHLDLLADNSLLPQCRESLKGRHRNIVHLQYRENLKHIIVLMSSYFHRLFIGRNNLSNDNRAGTKIFALVLSAVMKRDSLQKQKSYNVCNRTCLHCPLFLLSLKNGKHEYSVNQFYQYQEILSSM